MIPIWIINYSSIVLGLLLALWLKKVSWKVLACSLIFSRIVDVISSVKVLNLQRGWRDYSAEANHLVCNMLLKINLPDIFIFIIHSILLISLILIISKLFWRYSPFSRFCVRLVMLSITIAGIAISISNFWLFFSGEII